MDQQNLMTLYQKVESEKENNLEGSKETLWFHF